MHIGVFAINSGACVSPDVMIEVAGRGSYRIVPFPPEKKAIDIGSVYADYSKITRALGWAPTVEMREGLEQTMSFSRDHRAEYWGELAVAR